MSKSLQNLPVLRHYHLLNESIVRLTKKVESAHFDVDLLYDTDIKPIKAVSKAVSALCYTDLQVGRELIQLPGVVFVPKSVVDFIEAVNIEKDTFLDVVKDFKANSGFKSNEGALSKLRGVFAEEDIGRVHFKQCERKIVVVQNIPKKIRWYTESGGWGGQKKFTKQEALDFVGRMMSDNPDGRLVCEKLIQNIGDSELIVQRNKSADATKVSLTYNNLSPSSHIASLPIFVVVDSAEQVKQIKLEKISITSKNNGTSKSRSKFEDSPYIDSLRLYRYKEAYR